MAASDVKQLKQRVRDHLDPDRDLGHLDRFLLTKATGRHETIHYAGSPGAGAEGWKQGPVQGSFEPQQRGNVMKIKLRLGARRARAAAT